MLKTLKMRFYKTAIIKVELYKNQSIKYTNVTEVFE